MGLVSTVHELSSREKSQQSWDLSPGALGEKCEHFLCAMQSPATKKFYIKQKLTVVIFLVLPLCIYYVCPHKAWLNLFLSNANVIATFTSVFILILSPHAQKKKNIQI